MRKDVLPRLLCSDDIRHDGPWCAPGIEGVCVRGGFGLGFIQECCAAEGIRRYKGGARVFLEAICSIPSVASRIGVDVIPKIWAADTTRHPHWSVQVIKFARSFAKSSVNAPSLITRKRPKRATRYPYSNIHSL